MLYDIIITPIELIVDWVFSFFIVKIPQLGVIGAIVGVSIVINILALPLYNIADAIQDKERKIKGRLEPRVKRIKKAFKGDEQFLILSEYYRQNGYHPLYVMRSATSLLIQIPFFMAAYNYLSSSEVLRQSSFWLFSNLGAPDGLLNLNLFGFALSVNILPIIMTLINFVSGYIYTREAALSDKVQLYGLGVFFLILLYSSPSGLVIYWIMNNIFSLAKNIVMRTKRPGLVLHGFCSIALWLAAVFFLRGQRKYLVAFLFVFAFVFSVFPYGVYFIRKKYPKRKIECTLEKNNGTLTIVIFSGLALSLMSGLLLPSSTIATSPLEFSFIGAIDNPVSFVWSTLWPFVGLFLFWPVVIHQMFGKTVKKFEAAIMFTLLVVAGFDAFLFKSEYGSLSAQFFLVNNDVLDPEGLLMMAGPFFVGCVSFILYCVLDAKSKKGVLSLLALSVSLAELGLGIYNVSNINNTYNEYVSMIKERGDDQADDFSPIYHLSKEGKNVVILFLDRAGNPFFPYALEEEPKIKEQFDGFVYYPNTVSFGMSTAIAYPSMIGGYEYTPERINERSEEYLRDKHNEATLVMPKLFLDAGYSVTVTDPSFPNYTGRGDLSAFESLPEVNAREMYSKYRNEYLKDTQSEVVSNPEEGTIKGARNFSVMQMLPPMFRNMFYALCWSGDGSEYLAFVDNISTLHFLPLLSDVTSDKNSFIYIGNEATHSPCYLDETYTHYRTKETAAEIKFNAESDNAYQHFQVLMAALTRIGNWFDWMKENGVYDNTRIIIVSDHGNGEGINNVIDGARARYMPLLLVKDFDSRGEIETDWSLMTNADTLFLAKDGLEEVSDINPFTGNVLSSEKNDIIVWGTYGNEWSIRFLKNKKQFTLDSELGQMIVGNNVYDASNWKSIEN